MTTTLDDPDAWRPDTCQRCGRHVLPRAAGVDVDGRHWGCYRCAKCGRLWFADLPDAA